MTDTTESGRGPKTALGAYAIIPILATALTVYYAISTMDLVWEARATGLFIGGFLLLLCGIQFARFAVQLLKGEGSLGLGELVENSHFNRQRLVLLLLVLTFIVTLPWLGVTVGLFLTLVACMLVMGVRAPLVLISVAATAAAAVHLLLITLVGSQLPLGVLRPVLALFGGA